MNSPHPPHRNRLATATSPYLRQHAENPVDWYPWGDAAFAAARERNVPIFLSIGYATCHWCHVMAHESFEHAGIGELLNRDFVSIKVDREERPDIDAVYMEVAQRMNGQGGWPLTVLMTPDGLPFFAATYIPREGRHGRMGMRELLPLVAERWREMPEELRRGGEELLEVLKGESGAKGGRLDAELLKRADAALRADYDPHQGGFGRAPRFPRPHLLSYLLQRYSRTGDPHQLAMVEHTLDAMRRGGVYDQAGFGFHRYSTDDRWLVPHFEKMLYDQAGLARVYLEAFALTGKEEYAAVAREIFTYLRRDLADPVGGFFSAEDADAEGVEGKFYVWELEEIEQVLGEDAERFARLASLHRDGNYREEVPGHGAGGNILHLQRTWGEMAAAEGVDEGDLRLWYLECCASLRQAREGRVRPFRDEKLLCAWNAMVLQALALGGVVLDDEGLVAEAQGLAAVINRRMSGPDGRLLRAAPGGDAEEGIGAFAEDHAFLGKALLTLFLATGDPEHLQGALRLAQELLDRFLDTREGGLFDSAHDAERLVLRAKSRFDGAMPAAGSVALSLFARLYRLTGDARWQQGGEGMLQGVEGLITHYPQGFCGLLKGFDDLCGGLTLALVTEGEGEGALVEALRRAWRPQLLILPLHREHRPVLSDLLPVCADIPETASARVHICRGDACLPPCDDPVEVRRILREG